MRAYRWSLESSAVAAELKRFIAGKCVQVHAEMRAPEHPISPESSSFFAAAERSDWPGLFDAIAAMHQAMREGKSRHSPSAVYPVEWAVVNEIGAALEEFAAGPEEYAIAFARDIINSIAAGSIYFGGTDAGRFLVTALSRSHTSGDPFFTITQNALADHRSYLRYLRAMYGSLIYIPTEADATRALDEYREDAERRRREGKLFPGEIFEDVGGQLKISGVLSVMAINGLLSKLIFDKNPECEFYVEESFPLNWMYPHLSPHQLIMKINQQPISELPHEILHRDREYWSRYIRPIVGDWLIPETELAEIVAFVDKIYSRQDLSGFRGDPRYIRNEIPQKNFSKLRSSIGGIYAWRAQNTQSSDQKERYLREADFAFRQALVLCPASPEAVFRYINLLVGQKRLDDAIFLVEAGVRLEQKPKRATRKVSHIQEDFSHKRMIPSQLNPSTRLTQLGNLLEQLKRMKAQQR
jgi:hypothetical protein